MIEKMMLDATQAHTLQESIVQSVFDYVDEDVARSSFGVNAALQAGVELAKNSSMSTQTRMALAQTVFQAMTEDIDLRSHY